MDGAQQLLIPEKLKVGFQDRQGTYTGKLAFVVYYDNKGVLRKEKSWETWRDEKIEAKEYTNEPTEGFVLNKSGGGARQSYGWNARNEFIRVYDPRGFEFEISLPNLLFILRETDCSRGKGLEGKFVYSWSGQELVLLPAESEDYKNSKMFTSLQGHRVKFKEMVPGTTFTTNKQKDLTYLGKFDYYFAYFPGGYGPGSTKKDASGREKRFIFWDGKNFMSLRELKSIAVLKSDTVHPDFADLVTSYGKSEHGSAVTELFLREVEETEKSPHYWLSPSWFYEMSPGVYVEAVSRYKYVSGAPADIEAIECSHSYTIIKGVLTRSSYRMNAFPPGVSTSSYYYSRSQLATWREPTNHRLFARTAAGGEHRVTSSTFQKEK